MKKDPSDPMEEFRKRFEDMLKGANPGIVFGPPPQSGPPAGAPQRHEPGEDEQKREAALKRIREFNLKPRQIRDYLDRYVIRQDDAKKVLAVSICDHYNHVRRCIQEPAFADREYSKHNIILLGPTGVGKTYMVRCIAKLIGVPFVKADATKFSETGYVGHDVEDLARDLVKAADGDVDLAGYGIIFLDEIDKIAGAPVSSGRDVSGRGVQVNLLKLMEETDVSLHSQTDLIGQVQAMMEMQRGKSPKRTINTRHMLFIVSGAFDGLADLVRQRVASSKIGFGQPGMGDQPEDALLRRAQTRDFIKYGFEPEFIGRLPVRVVCEKLSADDLAMILNSSEGSVLRQYKSDFEGYGIDLSVGDDAVKQIAVQAEKENTGARGLMTVFERILRDFKFELPSTTAKNINIDAAAVTDPARALKAVLEKAGEETDATLNSELKQYCDAFEKEHGFKLRFTPAAAARIIEIGGSSAGAVRAVCEERFRDLQHGLSLVARNTGRNSFSITLKMVESPGKELSKLIAESFGRAGREHQGNE